MEGNIGNSLFHEFFIGWMLNVIDPKTLRKPFNLKKPIEWRTLVLAEALQVYYNQPLYLG